MDTSAFYALLDAADENHKAAVLIFDWLRERAAALVTSNYVMVETVALLQGRLGLKAVRTFERDVLPVVAVSWVAPEVHLAAAAVHVAADRARLSLVDCVSFQLMRDLEIREAFAFDRHFVQEGFGLAGAAR